MLFYGGKNFKGKIGKIDANLFEDPDTSANVLQKKKTVLGRNIKGKIIWNPNAFTQKFEEPKKFDNFKKFQLLKKKFTSMFYSAAKGATVPNGRSLLREKV